MPTIRFVDGGERVFTPLVEVAKGSSQIAARLAEIDDEMSPAAALFIHHPGTEDCPQLFEVEMPPNMKVDAHAHETDEIVVVAKGSAVFGKRTYGPGSSVMIPKMTLYSFQAGPQGLTYLNFRPTIDFGAISKDEFLARRFEAQRVPVRPEAEDSPTAHS
jgi:hypothetical protein